MRPGKDGGKDIDRLTENLQKMVDLEEESYYSKQVIAEYRDPVHFGKMEDPDATAEKTGPCGDTMRMDLKVEDGMVTDARFTTDGCGASMACGNMTAKMAIGTSLRDAARLTPESLLERLGGLPDEHRHCAVLAMDTLHAALKGKAGKNDASAPSKKEQRA